MPAPAVAAIFSAVLLGRRSGLPAGFVGRAVAAASGAVFLALPLGLRADLQFSAISMAAAGAFRRLEVDVAGGIDVGVAACVQVRALEVRVLVRADGHVAANRERSRIDRKSTRLNSSH